MGRTPNRAARKRQARGAPRDLAALRARLAATASRADGLTERAARMLDAWLGHAEAHGMPFSEVVARLAGGAAAVQIAEVDRGPQAARLSGMACASGCAFCCILTGADGGTLTEAEAVRLHEALAPLAGAPDGRDWHPAACAALDPETRTCRAYDARPMLCRTFHSTDADACRSNAEGHAAPGAGVLAAQALLIEVQALARECLKGSAKVPTYSLAAVAAQTAEGADRAAALAAARHPPRALGDERARLRTARRS